MPLVTCTIKVDAKVGVAKYSILIDDKRIALDSKGKGTRALPTMKELHLYWKVCGDHGSEYKIEVKPPIGYKAVFEGTHPVARKVPQVFNCSADVMRFFIKG